MVRAYAAPVRSRLMIRRVNRDLRLYVAVVLIVIGWLGSPSPAFAQTTVILDAPGSESVDTTIRGGSYASTNFQNDVLMTRASDDVEYERRALIKFDTENFVPAKSTIQSAKLTLTVAGGNTETRKLSLYRVVNSFDEGGANWNQRKSAYNWATKGGDLGAKYAEATAYGAVGSKVTFDVTKLVQEMVNAATGNSRWTRVAILDDGTSTSLSYREFYPSETSTSTNRPTLTVVFGGSSSTPPPSTSPSTSTGSVLFRLLHWNVHHGGRRTDGVTDPGGLVNWIASFKPDAMSLNEVDDEGQASAILSRLEAKTGINWTSHYDGRGNQLIVKTSLLAGTNCVVNSADGRKAGHVSVKANNRTLNIWSAHLSVDSATERKAEVKALKACGLSWSEARIAAGDYNMQADTAEYIEMAIGQYDAWRNAPTKINYPGNCDGCTRNSRIDYVFSSKGATWLVLKSAQIYDTRSSTGVMPSDHKPMVVTYEVR
jgi:endonuclease/exonuclease/phosphatase family metal-dependent hydrolase